MSATPSTSLKFARCSCLGALLMVAAVCGAVSVSEKTVEQTGMAPLAVDMGSTVDALLVLDPTAFGSTAGQTSMRAAPTTWSSRSNVRWNARWDARGRFLV